MRDGPPGVARLSLVGFLAEYGVIGAIATSGAGTPSIRGAQRRRFDHRAECQIIVFHHMHESEGDERVESLGGQA